MRHRIVFLPDYGMAMAQKLYPGCDVWLNNPLRPLEACGTSGMKAALNGCLNLSVLDGWWDEWFEPDFGWAIPTADGVAARTTTAATTWRPAPCTSCSSSGSTPRFYDRGRQRPARPLDRDGPPDPHHARPEGAGRPHGPRVRGAAVRPGRPAPTAP